MKTVKLTPMEMYQAGIVGLARRIDSMQRRLNGCPLNGWQIDIEGALAEMAFAKAMGVYAGLTINNYKGADIGDYHVRSSVKSDACLIIRPEDDPNAVYVLVTGAEGDYTVHGWIKGSDARNEDYWMAPNSRPGAWFVPQSALMGL